MPDRDDRRSINFPDEGFLFLCNGAGLEIHVTDYHARPLKLSWDTLIGWRTEATSAQIAFPLEGCPSEPPRQAPSALPSLWEISR